MQSFNFYRILLKKGINKLGDMYKNLIVLNFETPNSLKESRFFRISQANELIHLNFIFFQKLSLSPPISLKTRNPERVKRNLAKRLLLIQYPPIPSVLLMTWETTLPPIPTRAYTAEPAPVVFPTRCSRASFNGRLRKSSDSIRTSLVCSNSPFVVISLDDETT